MLRKGDIDDDRIKSNLTECTKNLIHEYCQGKALSEHEETKKFYTVRSLIYGATLMLDNGELENNADTIKMIRERIEEEFE